MAYFIISDIFQDIVLINYSCYWKMKDNCASAGLASFLADKVTPTFLLLPLSAGFCERDFGYMRSTFIIVFLCEFSFRQFLTLQLNLKGVSPENEPKKKNKQTNKRRNVESMDRS